MKMKLNYAVASDRGLVRGNNEDSAYAGPHLIALADGMGGHAAGEIASQLMINYIMNLDVDPADNDMLALLATTADDANRAIAQGVRENPETDGMGTTLTALMFDGTGFGMAHVGDSRGYRLRAGKLEQLTKDDTYVQSLVDLGELDPEDVSTHPQRSIILKAYTGRAVEPTLTHVSAQIGDRFLLCSDGLSDPVTASTIEQTLGSGTPQEAADKLVELALRSGGPDNVTVVVAEIVEDTEEKSGETPVVGVTAGALNGEQPENPRPDTAAGRAAIALKAREPQTIPEAPTTEDPEAPKKKRFLWPLIGVLLVVALIVGGFYWFKSSLRDTYFISTQGDTLVIENGSNTEIFGASLHKPYQYACLDRDKNITTIPTDSTDDCHRFVVTDLTESARAKVQSLPEGSYDEVLQQLRRLADETLPPCTTRTNATDKSRPGDLSSPGIDCREVK